MSQEVQRNLDEMKQALEKILQATSPQTVSHLAEHERQDVEKVAEIARLHSYAADAYAHLLNVLAGRKS